jgi:hypothetical protein
VTGFAERTSYEIISDLIVYTMSAHWIPNVLTEEHKGKRMAALLENLCYTRMKERHEIIIMGDESWMY